jgi:hypothetical protein
MKRDRGLRVDFTSGWSSEQRSGAAGLRRTGEAEEADLDGEEADPAGEHQVTNRNTSPTEEDGRTPRAPRSTHGRRSGALSKQIHGGGTERKPPGNEASATDTTLHRRRSLTWVEGRRRRTRRRGRRRSGGQRPLIKVEVFAGREGARSFPPSRASPPEPPAAAQNRPEIARRAQPSP